MASENVKSVLEEIAQKGSTPNRFSKKSFNKLLKAIANDPEFTTKVAITKNKELAEVQDVAVSKGFREFLKKVLEKAGVDKAESGMVLEDSFTIDNVDGLYEFFSAVIYEYMDAGNKYDFLPKEDFKGSISLKQNKEGSSIKDVRNPKTGETIGRFEYRNKAYKSLVASSACPEYLKTRKEVK